MNPDILCISETHLQKERTLRIDGYEYVPYNRTITHKDAPKTFGVIETFVKDTRFDLYDVKSIDKNIEGIQGLMFKYRFAEFSFIVFNCYLALVSSPYGKNETEFFSHLIFQLYLNNAAEIVYFCGDFNARTGNLKDSIEDIDSMPPRYAISGHGEVLIN